MVPGAPAKQIEFGASGTCKITLRAQCNAGLVTSSLAPEALAKTLHTYIIHKLRNGLESLGDTKIDKKLETLNPKPGFLSAGSGVCRQAKAKAKTKAKAKATAKATWML